MTEEGTAPEDLPADDSEEGPYVDLGLAILSVLLHPGESLTYDDIAAWCGCSHQTIQQIEQRALKRLRIRLKYIKDPRLVQLMEGLLEERTPASRTENQH